MTAHFLTRESRKIIEYKNKTKKRIKGAPLGPPKKIKRYLRSSKKRKRNRKANVCLQCVFILLKI